MSVVWVLSPPVVLFWVSTHPLGIQHPRYSPLEYSPLGTHTPNYLPHPGIHPLEGTWYQGYSLTPPKGPGTRDIPCGQTHACDNITFPNITFPQLLLFKFFAEKCMKMKEFGPRGASLSAPTWYANKIFVVLLSGIKFYHEVGFLCLGLKHGTYTTKVKVTANKLNEPVQILDHQELRKRFPYLATSQIHEGVYTNQKSGHISPRNLVTAQKMAAKKAGCDVINDVVKTHHAYWFGWIWDRGWEEWAANQNKEGVTCDRKLH